LTQNVSQSFQRWFHPDPTEETAASILANRRPMARIVRPSLILNRFTIHGKMGEHTITSHIKHSGLVP
jgi:hypothetical protein